MLKDLKCKKCGSETFRVVQKNTYWINAQEDLETGEIIAFEDANDISNKIVCNKCETEPDWDISTWELQLLILLFFYGEQK